MIVHRDTFHIRTDKMMEAVDLVKQSLTIAPPPGAVRIYTDFVGQSNTMAVETEYADLAEFETAYEAWFTNEKLADIGAEFNRIYSGQGHTEIWHVHN